MDVIRDNDLADALARAFQDEVRIRALLMRAGIETHRLPRLGMNAPIDYWVMLLQELKVGRAGEGALDRLLAEAAQSVPGNQTVRAAAIQFGVHEPAEDELRALVSADERERLRALIERAVVNVLAAGTHEPPKTGVVDQLQLEARRRLVDATDLESVWSDVSYKPTAWLMTAIERCQCVARIGLGHDQGVGTGVAIPASWVNNATGAPVLLTNAHVVSPDATVRADCAAQGVRTLEPDEAAVVFLGIDGRRLAEGWVRRVLWTSPPGELDASVLELDFDASSVALPPRLRGSIANVRRVNVIGHPNGGDKQFSLQDNRVDHDKTNAKRIYYSSPTDPGSSGSPLFDNDAWSLVGIHHGSANEERLNKGVPLPAILEAIEPS